MALHTHTGLEFLRVVIVRQSLRQQMHQLQTAQNDALHMVRVLVLLDVVT